MSRRNYIKRAKLLRAWPLLAHVGMLVRGSEAIRFKYHKGEHTKAANLLNLANAIRSNYRKD